MKHLVLLMGLAVAGACAGASPEGDTLGDEGELILLGSEPDPPPAPRDAGVDAGAVETDAL